MHGSLARRERRASSRMFHRCTVCFAAVAGAVALAGAPASAQSPGAISVTISPSVRAEAMGGVFLTAADDYSARWANPANLAFVDRQTVGVMFSQLVPDLADDVFYWFGGWSRPVEGLGTFALDLTYLSYGESQATDEFGNPQGTFSSYELSPAVGFGFQFIPGKVGVGVAAKYVRVDLAPESVLSDPTGSGSGVGTSWAFDLGVNYHHPWFQLAGVVSNLGPDITFIDAEQSDPMPRTARVGGLFRAYNGEFGTLSVAGEWEQTLVTLERSPVYHAGGEFVYAATFAIRAGYVNDQDGDISGPTAGFGVSWAQAAFEYANVPQAEGLDRVDRFALWYRF